MSSFYEMMRIYWYFVSLKLPFYLKYQVGPAFFICFLDSQELAHSLKKLLYLYSCGLQSKIFQKVKCTTKKHLSRIRRYYLGKASYH